MLHTINKSPWSSRNLAQALRHVKSGDSILLYEDGVFAVKAGTKYGDLLAKASSSVKVYALSADVKARGLTDIAEGVVITDYEGFVDLVAANKVNPVL